MTSEYRFHWRSLVHQLPRLAIVMALLVRSATTFAQGKEEAITMQLQHESLQAGFNKIEAQSTFRFAYAKNLVAKYTDVNVANGTRPLSKTLDLLLAATDLNWQLVKTSIIITAKTKAPTNIFDVFRAKNITGMVKDTKGKPIAFASVVNTETQTAISTNENGMFKLDLVLAEAVKNATVEISYVDKQSVKKTVTFESGTANVDVVLQELSLSLKEVQVNGLHQSSSASNSSITFGRQAIDQVQPTSIADVLQYLPGQTVTPPDLQNAKTINLRNNFSESRLENNKDYVNNAAFGTAIIIDGSPVSNNGNMQALNIGKNGSAQSLTAKVTTGSAGVGSTYTPDFAASGFDLRQIPTNNIESIEVVSGVASAKYGDLTDGAVIVNRQAGATMYNLSARFREGTANFQLEKGFSLGKKLGSINISVDYLYSTADPRDNTKYYNRVNTGLIWTSFLDKAKKFKHTLSVDYTKSLDGTKSDPDDKTLSTSKFNFNSIALSDRGEIKVNKKWSRSINYNLRYSNTTQNSYSQNFVNQASALFVTDSKQEGIREGIVVPGYNYIYAQQLKGNPISMFGRLENNLTAHTGSLPHMISMGVSIAYDANKGDGWQYNYKKPPLGSSGGSSGFKSDRPYTFSEMNPVSTILSAYMEDRIVTPKWKRKLELRAGLRYDYQNKYNVLSPRISANWNVAPHIKLNAAYGISSKAPSLAYTNPGPLYFDYPLLKLFNGVNGDNSLYLPYTDIIYNKNIALKPSSSTNYEVGTTINTKWVDISVTAFNKKLNRGFTTIQAVNPMTLPVYDTLARTNAADKWQYYKTGRDTTYQSSYSTPINGLSSNTQGLELVINTQKIKAIQTSFFFTTAYYHGKYHNEATSIDATPNLNDIARYGVYTRPDATSNTVKSTLVSTHHFPQLGFIVNITSEFFWYGSSQEYNSATQYPIGYYDKELKYFAIDPKDANNPLYANLVQVLSDYKPKTVPFYTNFHLRLSKEIGNLRMSFSAYNVFNIRPEYIDNTNPAKPVIILNQTPSYGAELVLKF